MQHLQSAKAIEVKTPAYFLSFGVFVDQLVFSCIFETCLMVKQLQFDLTCQV